MDLDRSVPDIPPGLSDAEGGAGLSRRTLLKVGLGGGLLVAAGSKWVTHSQAQAEVETEVKAEYALIIDLNKCTGCGACRGACAQRNDLPEGTSYIHRLKKEGEEACWCLPIQCQHCQDAPCEQVCPTKATYRHASGVVLVNEKMCVGCKYCIEACPYGARIYNEHSGVANKCWLCLDWVLGGGQPACVQACVPGARIFGRRDDPEIAELLASGRTQCLHPEFGTKPGIVHYICPGH
jgi:Fe-S-cluster-containing dehydrogenase component